MWYLIVAASGLVLGLGLLIWALRERQVKHEAIISLEKARSAVKDLRIDIARTRNEAAVNRLDRNRAQAQIDVLHKTVNGLHEQLAACEDPVAVAKLLRAELGEQL